MDKASIIMHILDILDVVILSYWVYLTVYLDVDKDNTQQKTKHRKGQ